MQQPQPQHHSFKKARYMSEWESSYTTSKTLPPDHPKLGLRELFGGRRVRPQESSSPNQQQQQPQPLRRFFREQQRNGFFTLRLEHRSGGALAQHLNEERILLFRSDRAGAIAKIIYSSAPSTRVNSNSSNNNNTTQQEDWLSMVQAKIHVLDVKEPYRGHDLGGLLFAEAIRSLRHRYMDDDEEEVDEERDPDNSFVSNAVRCQLDAEEDIRRHNKLIHFYEQLGCHVKPKAKVQYINNNDGEMYRKIPMQMALRPSNPHSNSETKSNVPKRHKFLAGDGSLVHRGPFLPVQFTHAGAAVQFPLFAGKRRVDWLVVDDGQGGIQFRTTQGHFLRANPNGKCAAAVVSEPESSDDASDNDNVNHTTPPETWASFTLHRVSDALPSSSSCDEDDSDYDLEAQTNAKQKELWLLESAHGTFLTADASHHIYCSKVPAFWQADDDTFSLKCTSDTPPRRQHYRRAWTKQTVLYNQAMRERYLSFRLTKLSLWEALDLVQNTPYNPFRIGRNRAGKSSPSIRTLCFRTAEACRLAGHPDWVQFIALVHELGTVVNFLDHSTAADSLNDYDWTVTHRTRVVGCAAPDRSTFSEFRRLNADEKDARYSTPQGMYDAHCGLSRTLLSWTGPEYMYHFLRHNDSSVPEEGFAMLRYFLLGDWHTHNEYAHLTNDQDADVQPFVAEFDQLRRAARRENSDSEDLSDQDCRKLWEEHYVFVVAKYIGDGALEW